MRGGGDAGSWCRLMLLTRQSDLNLVTHIEREKGEIKTRRKRRKMTVTQGKTRAHNLANGLPCSNQQSFRVTQQLSGWVRLLKAELPGIKPKHIPSWHVRWGGCDKCENQGAGSCSCVHFDFTHSFVHMTRRFVNQDCPTYLNLNLVALIIFFSWA